MKKQQKRKQQPKTKEEPQALEIVAVVDRSGSMQSIKDDAIGGFNRFLAEQKKAEGKTTMTLVQFDDVYEVLHDGKAVTDIPDYTVETYVPRNWTALFDAVGRAVKTVSTRWDKLPEAKRPKVMVAILTDGHENASKEFKREDILGLVKEREAKGWKFAYLGVGQEQMEAEAVTMSLGIVPQRTYTVSHTAKGMSAGYGTMCFAANLVRGGASDDDYTSAKVEEEEEK